MRPLPINDERAEDFYQLCLVEIGTLDDVANIIEERSHTFISVDELTKFFRTELDESDASVLTKALVSFRRLCDRRNESESEVIGAARAGLTKYGWSDDEVKLWDDLAPVLEKLLKSEALKVATKASDLYYRHKLHIHDMKIVSDMRPIFDDERGDLLNFIINNTLHLLYSDNFENEVYLEISIGVDDLEQLRGEIDRAVKKTTILESHIETKFRVKPRIYGK